MAAYAVGHLPSIRWRQVSDPLLLVMCIVDAVLLYLMSYTSNIIVCYVLYIVFKVSYQLLMTVARSVPSLPPTSDSTLLINELVLQSNLFFAYFDHNSFEVADIVQEETFGLIFGINTFNALLLSTIVTFVLISNTGFTATPKTQVHRHHYYLPRCPINVIEAKLIYLIAYNNHKSFQHVTLIVSGLFRLLCADGNRVCSSHS